jgi:hypothetical protein
MAKKKKTLIRNRDEAQEMFQIHSALVDWLNSQGVKPRFAIEAMMVVSAVALAKMTQERGGGKKRFKSNLKAAIRTLKLWSAKDFKEFLHKT